MKEVPVGETFEYDGEEYLVVADPSLGCRACAFIDVPCSPVRESAQRCGQHSRKDHTEVTFLPYKDYILKRLGAKP